MDTAQEALFRDMLNHGWFTESYGDVESPTGYFGYVVNAWGEYNEVRNNFFDTISAYGDVAPMDFYGVYSAWINSDGIVTIHRHGDYEPDRTVPAIGIYETPVVREAMELFKMNSDYYSDWADS